MIRKVIYIVIVFSSQLAHSQMSQEEVLSRIIELQVVQDDFLDAGLFPTTRSWSFSGNEVPDNTIFFTAAICAGFQQLKSQGKWEGDPRIANLIYRASSNFWRYRSRKRRFTFNFWQTTPPDLPFPNGSKILSNQSMRLPDDLYTSVLVAMSVPENDSLQRKLREELSAYSARSNREAVDLYTPREYETFQAYELWFGKEMPQTFDISVMSNVLLFVCMNDFTLNTYDSATAQLIREMVKNRDYIRRINEVSLHTDDVAMVLNQLSKLISADSLGVFSDLKDPVMEDIRELLPEAESEIEKMLLVTAAARMGADSSQKIDEQKLAEEIPYFSHFYISPFAVTKGKRNLNALLPTVSWVCEAYNWMLYLEYLNYKKY